MNANKLPEWAILLFVVISLPTLGCFGYYSAAGLQQASGILIFLVSMSYPLALIGIVGLFRAIHHPRRRPLAIYFWGLCILIPAIILGIWT